MNLQKYQPYPHNIIAQVRPDSTFDNFEIEPGNESQKAAIKVLRNLTSLLVEGAENIKKLELPFRKGRIFNLFGKPGRGKSHLLESIVTEVGERCPELIERMVFTRSRFSLDHLFDDQAYGGAPIILIDDLFQDQSTIDKLGYSELKAFMNFITMVYNRRNLVFMTCNFSIMQDRGILWKLKQEKKDEVGRIDSRAKELFGISRELELKGEDFREELSRRDHTIKLF